MGVADGPSFAPPKPGSKPIIAPPCKCPECRPGPGIDRPTRNLGELTRVIAYDFCPGCKATTVATSVRMNNYWLNRCKDAGHTWRTFD